MILQQENVFLNVLLVHQYIMDQIFLDYVIYNVYKVSLLILPSDNVQINVQIIPLEIIQLDNVYQFVFNLKIPMLIL